MGGCHSHSGPHLHGQSHHLLQQGCPASRAGNQVLLVRSNVGPLPTSGYKLTWGLLGPGSPAGGPEGGSASSQGAQGVWTWL